MIMSSTVWTDALGNTRITLLRSSSGAGPLLPKMQACVNADWLECWEGPQSTQVPITLALQYINASAAATLIFLCADGTMAAIVLYAPKTDIFLADQVTVDAGQADVAALITQAVGTLQSSSGSLAVSYLSGSLGPRPQSQG